MYNITDGTYKEEFFVKDHLGNVRSTVDVYTYPVTSYLATYEVASAHLEGLVFDKVSEIAEDNPDPGNLQLFFFFCCIFKIMTYIYVIKLNVALLVA